MTAEEMALDRLRADPLFEVMVKTITEKATKYCYAKAVLGKKYGVGNDIDIMIREQVLDTVQKYEKMQF